MIRESYIFNTILVHVARTWERVRVQQPYQEMPLDNIESVDVIVDIADKIAKDKVIVKFLSTQGVNWDWSEETDEACSDTYIESLATKLITDTLRKVGDK